jgi:PAS domain-containing protein
MNTEKHKFTNARTLREKAEKLLAENKKILNNKHIETDLQKLLHELQVHQIELEMQNDELMEAYQTAETALKKYTMLYDLAPMGYFTISGDGSICELNLTGAEILGDRHFSLIKANIKAFISDESMKVFNVFFNEIFTSSHKVSCVVSITTGRETERKVYFEGVATDDNSQCLISVIDVSNLCP